MILNVLPKEDPMRPYMDYIPTGRQRGEPHQEKHLHAFRQIYHRYNRLPVPTAPTQDLPIQFSYRNRQFFDLFHVFLFCSSPLLHPTPDFIVGNTFAFFGLLFRPVKHSVDFIHSKTRQWRWQFFLRLSHPRKLLQLSAQPYHIGRWQCTTQIIPKP